MSRKATHYRSILKASSLIGGASLINLLIGMVRVKFVAVLLGPAGVGLMGTYVTITTLVNTVSGMGISTSGVRQISESYGAGNQESISRTVTAVRRTVWLTGALGMLLTAAGALWLSRWSFGNEDHTVPVALLSVTVLLAAITSGQACLLQGARRIADMAKVSVVGAVNGTLIGIPCYYAWGMRGIVPSLILGSIAGLATSWWFARRVPVEPRQVPYRKSLSDSKRLLLFGLPLMLSGLAGTLSSYLIRIVMIREVGLDGVGVYQAAFSLSGLIVNYVLLAMAADYYPRLTTVAHDNQRVGEEVNTQTEVALLLAGPALMATFMFAPIAIHIFYSGRFDAAVEILRWAVYGVFWRVVSWPMGFILLAKAKGSLFLTTEVFAGVFHLAAIWFCTRHWGLPGTGMAYVLMNAVCTVIMLGLFLGLTGRTWSRTVVFITFGVLGLMVLAGLISLTSWSGWLTWPLNLGLLSGLSLACLWRLSRKTGLNLQTVLAKLGLKARPQA